MLIMLNDLTEVTLPRFRHIMQSLLTCRMLLELRQYGKHSSNGDDSSEYTWGDSAPLDSLVFIQPGALVGSGSSETLHVLHTCQPTVTGRAHESREAYTVL